MTRGLSLLVLLLAATAVGAPARPAAQQPAPTGPVVRGRLEAGDRTLRSGEFADVHTFEGVAGQTVTVDLTSAAFDPYVIVTAPSGDKKENDDWQGSASRSRIELTLEETGRYQVTVTSYEKDETGAYELAIAVGGTPPAAAANRQAAPPGTRVESGRLEPGDRTLSSGEYLDEFSFQGRRDERVVIDLRAADFDPYLMLYGPDGKIQDNDDHEGDPRRSLIAVTLPADGTYRVGVTSYGKDETGAYDLRIQQGAASAAPAAVPSGPRVERGRLQAGDDTLKSGEYVDAFTFEGQVGTRVTLDLESQEFDTYLIVVPPAGERKDNDDVEGRPGHSIIEADITEPGTYKVFVTSYEEGSTGAYELRIDTRASAAATASATTASRDLAGIDFGDSRDGRLSPDDGQLSDGEYRDLYAFDGQAGDRIVVELASREFDPYLIVIPPEGQQVDNDDVDGRQDLSRIEMPLRATGRYRIMATSYDAGKTGAYRLTLRRAAAAATVPAAGGRQAGRRVFGVFVGISDYGGRATNLRYTSEDARRMQQAMLRGGGMRESDSVVLVDRQATLANVQRAVDNVARQAGPDDMFVFFYSGHGARVERSGFQAADPDGYDETLSFYDRDLKDDDMAQWLAGIRAGTSLVVLDSCFSGGFSKDIITARGRMGLFSSEEDVTSNVAHKFRAGGYLAQFIADAVAEHLADDDADGETTAVELSQYLHDRYRSDVKAGSSDTSIVLAPTNYQHLVVDRGGVGPYDVLFRGMRARR